MPGTSKENHLGGAYDPGISFPDIRQKQILIDYFKLNESVTETSETNRCSRHVVYNILHRFFRQGHLEPLPNGRPQAKLDGFVVSFLVALVDEFPKATLSELQLMLMFYLGLEDFEIPSVASIDRKLVELGLTTKKLSPIPEIRMTAESHYCRGMFISWRNTMPINRIYFIDETGVYANSGFIYLLFNLSSIYLYNI